MVTPHVGWLNHVKSPIFQSQGTTWSRRMKCFASPFRSPLQCHCRQQRARWLPNRTRRSKSSRLSARSGSSLSAHLLRNRWKMDERGRFTQDFSILWQFSNVEQGDWAVDLGGILYVWTSGGNRTLLDLMLDTKEEVKTACAGKLWDLHIVSSVYQVNRKKNTHH